MVDKKWKEVFLEARYVVLATDERPLNEVRPAQKGGLGEHYEAGDYVEVRRLLKAVHEGAEAALTL